MTEEFQLKSLIKGATKNLKSLIVSPLKMQINNNPTEVVEGSNGYWLSFSIVSSHLEGIMWYLFKEIHCIRVHIIFFTIFFN